LVTTLIARRSQYHQQILVDYVRTGSANLQSAVAGLTQQITCSGVSPHDAQLRAYARIYQQVQAQAATLAYVDTFMVLCIGAGIMFVLSFLLKKNDPGGGRDLAIE